MTGKRRNTRAQQKVVDQLFALPYPIEDRLALLVIAIQGTAAKLEQAEVLEALTAYAQGAQERSA